MEKHMEDKFYQDSEKWDSKELGASMDHAVKVTIEEHEAITDALGLQLISIRLQKNLIEELKLIAKSHGIGYQPMIRDLLNRFVTAEKKKIMLDALEKGKAELLKEESQEECEETLTFEDESPRKAA
jgi:hypothetical protein